MDITGSTLDAQYERAIAEWPFIHQVEAEFGLPPFLLVAIGSKETNLRNIKGDYTQRSDEASPRYHGFGAWQRDIDAWGIPVGWMDDVEAQCRWSADLLRSNINRLGLSEGVRAYNGSGAAARAYRDDVLERMDYLTGLYGGRLVLINTPNPTQEATDMLYDCTTPDPDTHSQSGKTFLLRGAGPPLWVRDPADVTAIATAVKHVGELTYATHQSFGGK